MGPEVCITRNRHCTGCGDAHNPKSLVGEKVGVHELLPEYSKVNTIILLATAKASDVTCIHANKCRHEHMHAKFTR